MAHAPSRLAWAGLAGLLALGLLAAGARHLWRATAPEVPATAYTRPEAASPPALHAAAALPAVAAEPRACAFEPLLAAGEAGDGRFSIEALRGGGDAAPAAAYMAVAREAAGQGRPRDAETALIAACRLAAAQDPGPSATLADAQAELGRHYGEAIATGAARGNEAVLQRARELLASGVAGYAATLGVESSRTRVAAQRLAQVDRLAALPAGSDDATALARSSRSMGAAPATLASTDRREPREAGRPPRVRGTDLAQADGDLRRLQAQAASVSRDPEGMRRREQAAQARRQACADEACLQRWYAQRRAELLDEF